MPIQLFHIFCKGVAYGPSGIVGVVGVPCNCNVLFKVDVEILTSHTALCVARAALAELVAVLNYEVCPFLGENLLIAVLTAVEVDSAKLCNVNASDVETCCADGVTLGTACKCVLTAIGLAEETLCEELVELLAAYLGNYSRNEVECGVGVLVALVAVKLCFKS